MENRARFALIGFLLLAVTAAGFGFVYWLENVGGFGERESYRIRFESPVPGLLIGAAVQFNGIRVGEVTDLALNREDPREVMATIAIASDTPVRADTQVGLMFGGLTGVPEVTLAGGGPDAPPLPRDETGPPILVAPHTASLSWTEAARATFARTDQLLSENSDALREVLAGVAAFSEALGRNADKVDTIVAGLERMTGGAKDSAPTVISLQAPTRFPPIESIPPGQLIVSRPDSVVALETQWILVADNGGMVPSFPGVRWSDSLPRLIQAVVVETFENAGFVTVGTDMSDIEAEHRLAIALRAFRIADDAGPVAEVDMTAKIADADGSILAARRFRTTKPASALAPAAAAAALDQAFGEVATELVVWTLAEME